MTQLAVTSQKGKRLNYFKSLTLNLSSSDSAVLILSFLAAHASIQTKRKAMMSEKQQMKNPTSSAVPTLELSAIVVSTGPLILEPMRATLKLIPKAKDSSLPWNQAETMALWATVMLSPPRPKMKRPSIMIA